MSRDTIADFCILFGDRAMYAGHGFVPHDNPLRIVAMHHWRTGVVQTRSDPDDGLMVLPLGDRVWPEHTTVDLLGHSF